MHNSNYQVAHALKNDSVFARSTRVTAAKEHVADHHARSARFAGAKIFFAVLCFLNCLLNLLFTDTSGQLLCQFVGVYLRIRPIPTEREDINPHTGVCDVLNHHLITIVTGWRRRRATRPLETFYPLSSVGGQNIPLRRYSVTASQSGNFSVPKWICSPAKRSANRFWCDRPPDNRPGLGFYGG